MLIFIDTETTGLDQDDKICSIGLIIKGQDQREEKYELFNEAKKISPKASSVNHITNEMIKQKSKFLDSEAFDILQSHNDPATTLIGHNVNFDIQKLALSGFHNKMSVIDTLKVSKHIIKEIDEYALQFLRYELKLYMFLEEGLIAHNALDDAKVVEALYAYLLDFVSHEEMCELSFKNVLLEKLPFGKYKGRYIEEISIYDPSYLQWMLHELVDLDEDLRYSVNYYLQG